MTKAGPAPSWLARDSEEMLAATARLPAHIAAALDSPPVLSPPAGEPRSVVVLGMGGSAVAGAVLEQLCLERSRVPVVLAGGYRCPEIVGPGTLVFAVSFSGETEETLEAAASAIERGARVVALTGGGSLARLVSDHGGELIAIEDGIPQPRAGVGAMVAPLLLACEQQKILDGARRELSQAVTQLESRLPALVSGEGASKEVAQRIGRTIPIFHGASGLGSVAARRWKTQVNENAKAPAFSGEQPEVCHNEICGFGQNGDVTRQLVTLVNLRMPGEHPQVQRRFELVSELVREAVGDVVTVWGEGESSLACFFDLVAVGDVASLHLAGREGIDPGPVPILTELKDELRRHGRG